MARARKCDRCGSFYEPKGIPIDVDPVNAIYTIDRDFNDLYLGVKIYDLCPNCLDSFKYWLKYGYKNEGKDDPC